MIFICNDKNFCVALISYSFFLSLFPTWAILCRLISFTFISTQTLIWSLNLYIILILVLLVRLLHELNLILFKLDKN